MTLRAAAEQALDTLEHVQAHIGRYDPPVVTTIARAMQPTIDALRAALAAEQPQPEAVAWPKVNGTARMFDNARALMVIMEREPTDDEMRAFDDAIKGWGTSPPAAPQPEKQPVAWMLNGGTDIYLASEFAPGSEHEGEWTPLYAAPPPSAPEPSEAVPYQPTDDEVTAACMAFSAAAFGNETARQAKVRAGAMAIALRAAAAARNTNPA